MHPCLRSFVLVPGLALVFLACEPSPRLAYSAKPQPDEVIEFKSVAEGKNLTLHVFRPPVDAPAVSDFDQAATSDQDGISPRPAIVLFFGGGWVGGSPGHFASQARHLADRGMVAICPEYRTLKSHGTDPRACVADGKSAMRYVRAHADQLGIDPDRIAAGGGSAGGHVAAATSLVDAFDDPGDDPSISCRPSALVLFNPVFDNGPGQWGHAKVTSYWQDISPAHRIDDEAVPTIIFLGTDDQLIPVATAERYRDQMKSVGVPCDLELYPGAGHGFFNSGKAYQDTLEKADAFLVGLGYLPASH